MFGSEVLEVGIGLILLFLIISLICTALREALEGFLKTRAGDLERGIRELLNDPHGNDVAKALFEHPLVSGLFAGEYQPGGRNLPSYIPAANFAGALLDIAARGRNITTNGSTDPISTDAIRANMASLGNPKLERAILTALDFANDDVALAKANLENWFNSAMDRVSGWYKRRTQWILLGLGFAAAMVMNIDAITVAQKLTHDRALRDAVVAEAERAQSAANGLSVLEAEGFEELRSRLTSIGYPVGWPPPQGRACDANGKCSWKDFGFLTLVSMIFGWAVTALAVMLGAPFWFDVLNKFMIIRSTVKPHEKSGEEGSEDRHPSPSEQAAVTLSSGTTRGDLKRSLRTTGAEQGASPVHLPVFESHTWRDGSKEGLL